MTQTVSTEEVKYLIIECYCDNGVEIKKTKAKTIQIDIKGKLKSVGYHGKQEIPKEIREETLSFKTELKNDPLRIISKEWRFSHHSYLVDEIKIQIPKGIKYKIVKVQWGQLERREIK